MTPVSELARLAEQALAEGRLHEWFTDRRTVAPSSEQEHYPMKNLYASLTVPRNLIVVRKLASRSVTAGGIHLPENAKEEFHRGIVEKCGPAVKTGETATDLDPGDLVLYGGYAGTWVKLGDVERLVMSCEQVEGYVKAEHVETVTDADGAERLVEEAPEPVAPVAARPSLVSLS